MKPERLLHIAALTLEQKGCTFTREGEIITPLSGYAVSVAGGKVIPLSNDICKYLHDIERSIADLAVHQTPYFGTWTEAGLLYIDAALVLEDLETALDVGRLNGQMAVYDFAAGTSIAIDAIEIEEVTK